NALSEFNNTRLQAAVYFAAPKKIMGSAHMLITTQGDIEVRSQTSYGWTTRTLTPGCTTVAMAQNMAIIGKNNGSCDLFIADATEQAGEYPDKIQAIGAITSLALDSKAVIAVTGTVSRSIQIWDLCGDLKKSVQEYRVKGIPQALSLSDTGMLAVGFGD